jgi:protein-S-isoprenylcysteine O-methyltransferase Ste14
LAICIAAASLLLLLATILLILVTHGVILGEEQYCMTTYGEDYAWYKARTPRYFLLK